MSGLPKPHSEAALPFQVLEAYIQTIEKQIIISVYLWYNKYNPGTSFVSQLSRSRLE